MKPTYLKCNHLLKLCARVPRVYKSMINCRLAFFQRNQWKNREEKGGKEIKIWKKKEREAERKAKKESENCRKHIDHSKNYWKQSKMNSHTERGKMSMDSSRDYNARSHNKHKSFAIWVKCIHLFVQLHWVGFLCDMRKNMALTLHTQQTRIHIKWREKNEIKCVIDRLLFELDLCHVL